MKRWLSLLFVAILSVEGLSILYAQAGIPLLKCDKVNYNCNNLFCPDGSTIIVWEDSRFDDLDIMCQRFDAQGCPMWAEPLAICQAPGLQYNPSIVATSDGNFMVAWQEYHESYSWVQMQKINLMGQIIWGNGAITLAGTNVRYKQLKVLPNECGGAYLYYITTSDQGQQAKMQKVDAQGNSLLPTDGLQLFSSTEGLELQAVLSDYEGGAIVNLWDDYYPGSNPGLTHTFRVGSEGNIMGNIPTNQTAFGYSHYSVYPGIQGEYLLANTFGGAAPYIRIMKVSNTGVILHSAVNYNISPLHERNETTIRAFSNGTIVLSWLEASSENEGLYRFQEFCNNLSPIGSTVSFLTSFPYGKAEVAEAERGSMVVAYSTVNPDTGHNQLVLNKIGNQGQVLWGANGITVGPIFLTSTSSYSMNADNVHSPITLIWVWSEEYGHMTLRMQKVDDNGALIMNDEESTIVSWKAVPHTNLFLQKVGQNFIHISDGMGAYSVFSPQLSPILIDQSFSSSGNLFLYPGACAVNSQNRLGVVLQGDEERAYDCFLQEINADGSLAYPEPIRISSLEYITSMSKPYLWSIGSAFYLIWDEYSGGINRIMGQKILDGVCQWGTEGRSLIPETTQEGVRLLAAQDGYILFNDDHYHLTRITEDGLFAPGWDDTGISLFPASEHLLYEAILDFVGENVLVILKADWMAGGSHGYMQLITPQGNALWGPEGVVLPSTPQATSLICGVSIDSAINIAYLKNYIPEYDTGELAFIRYDFAGNLIPGSEQILDSELARFTYQADIMTFPDGWKKVIWWDNPQGSRYSDLFFADINPQGVCTNSAVLCAAPNLQISPLIMSGESTNLITWADSRAEIQLGEVPNFSIYAAFLASGGSELEDEHMAPATLISDVRNHPNPFQKETTISFKLSDSEKVSIEIYNLKGQKVRTLMAGYPAKAGEVSMAWDGKSDDGSPVTSGVYFWQVTAGRHHHASKLLLIK